MPLNFPLVPIATDTAPLAQGPSFLRAAHQEIANTQFQSNHHAVFGDEITEAEDIVEEAADDDTGDGLPQNLEYLLAAYCTVPSIGPGTDLEVTFEDLTEGDRAPTPGVSNVPNGAIEIVQYDPQLFCNYTVAEGKQKFFQDYTKNIKTKGCMVCTTNVPRSDNSGEQQRNYRYDWPEEWKVKLVKQFNALLDCVIHAKATGLTHYTSLDEAKFIKGYLQKWQSLHQDEEVRRYMIGDMRQIRQWAYNQQLAERKVLSTSRRYR